MVLSASCPVLCPVSLLVSTVSDVIEHSQLDLDMADIEAGADLLSEAGFTTAFTAYSEGGNR